MGSGCINQIDTEQKQTTQDQFKMPSVYNYRHVELDKVGRGKR